MDEIIRMLLSMGKTKEEIAEFVGKEMPAGGITKTTNIIKPITKKVAGDFPLIGSRITDPTQAGQLGRYNLQALDPKDRYSLIRQSIEDQKLNWQKTLEFIREGGYSLSKLQEQNLNFNLGVLQKSKVIIKDIEKGLINEGQNVEEIYQAFVKNKRFLGNEKTGLSGEANEILDFIETTRGKGEDLTKTTKSQEQILKDQKVANDKRMKRLYEGRPYEGDVGLYRTLGGYHLPKLHEAGIINLDPKVYEALKAGKYHHGGADFFAPDPNRILRYHFGSKIFDDLDKAIEKAAINGEGVPLKGPEGMIKFLKDNDYLPFKKDGPKNSLDYMTDGEKLERVKELDEGTELIKKGDSPFFKTPDAIMGRVMENANDKKLYLESFKRTHPEKYKLYEKTQSEEPFFGLGDVNQPDPFGDLSDLTFPKDKGDLIKFPKKKKIKPVDENKRLLTEDEIEDYTELLGDTEYWMMDGTLGEAKKALKISKAEEAEMFDLYKTGKLDPEAGSVTRSRMNFLKQRLEEAEGSGDTRLISEDEIFELEGLEKRFRKEDIEFKVNEQPERKLTDEEIKELKDLTDNNDFDLAEGGIINLAEGGRIGFNNGSEMPIDFRMPVPNAAQRQQFQRFNALNQQVFHKEPQTEYSKMIDKQSVYTPFNSGRIKEEFDNKMTDAFSAGREIENVTRFMPKPDFKTTNAIDRKFGKQGYSSDIRHGLGTSAFKDAAIDYVTSNTPLNSNSRLANDLGSFAANAGSLFTEIPDIFSQAKELSKDTGPYSGIIDYDETPDTSFLIQPFEDIAANYLGSKIPFSLRNNQAAKMDFLNNYKNYGNQTMNFIKEKRRQEIQARIKKAEIEQKQKEAAAAKEALQIQQTQRLAAQNQRNNTGGYQAGYGSDFMGGGDRGRGMGAADKGGSDSMGSFAKGGIIGLKR